MSTKSAKKKITILKYRYVIVRSVSFTTLLGSICIAGMLISAALLGQSGANYALAIRNIVERPEGATWWGLADTTS